MLFVAVVLVCFFFTAWFVYVVIRSAVYDTIHIQTSEQIPLNEKYYVTFWRELKRSFWYHFPKL